MADKLNDIINKELHPVAKEYAKNAVTDFAASIILQAKENALRDNDAELVLKGHVQEALDNIAKGQKRSWKTELRIALGGALFGAFLEGFVDALSPVNVTKIVIYVIMGFIGISLVFIGLRK